MIFRRIGINLETFFCASAPDILDANERTLEEQLAVTKMIASVDEPSATVMGILVLGKNPQDFLPGAYVQFLRIDGNELTDEILDNEAIRGAIPDQIRRLDDKLRAHNRIAVDITSGPPRKANGTLSDRSGTADHSKCNYAQDLRSDECPGSCLLV